MALRIHVVGSVQASAGSRVVGEGGLHGRLGGLGLAMLAFERRRRVGRDELAEELWPDTTPESWDTAVRVLVSKVRTALEGLDGATPVLIEPANGGYQLYLPPDGSVDLEDAAAAIHRAEAQLASGAIDAAGADALVASMIATRPFLPGADGPWATATRDRVAEIRLRALQVLADVWLAKGDPGQAARDAASLLRLDPYRETAHRLLMRAHAAAGDRGAAARAYRACRDLLAAELGVEPARETVELARVLGLDHWPPRD